jgi:hypothetical protein
MAMSNKVVKSMLWAAILLISPAMGGQKVKSWNEWSANEAKRIISNSGWARTLQFEHAEMEEDRILNRATLFMHIHFVSATPVRYAYARLLKLNYFKEDPYRHRLASELLALNYDDKIVVMIDCETNERRDQNMAYSLMEIFRTASVGAFGDKVYLELQTGGRLFLSSYQYIPTGGRFIFPRMVDGKLFIKPDAGWVRFCARLSRMSSVDMFRQDYMVVPDINVRFKISEFIYDGVLQY